MPSSGLTAGETGVRKNSGASGRTVGELCRARRRPALWVPCISAVEIREQVEEVGAAGKRMDESQVH